MITQTHRLDVVPGGITTVVHVKQYQTDESLVFELFSRFGDFEISAAFTECTVRGTKSDGNGYSANATCDPSNNSVTVQLTEQMTAVAGRQPYEITVTDSTGRMITTTFILDVHRAALDADTVESESVIKEVQTIVEEYIEENPGLFVVDPTLTQSGEAADAKVTGDEIADLNGAIGDLDDLETTDKTDLVSAINEVASTGSGGTGLSDEAKQALLDCFENVAWIGNDGQDYYDALEAALYPPADLVSISAVYTQSGTVYDTASLDDLKADLVVTAHYDNQTTATVTTYTLSGTLAEGTSTITVSYGGKTDTFTVTVTVWTTSPAIAKTDTYWNTSMQEASGTGFCITEKYWYDLDMTAIKASSRYDATNDYLTVDGAILNGKYLAPNTAGLSTTGKKFVYFGGDGVAFAYASETFGTSEAAFTSKRNSTAWTNISQNKIGISFTLVTDDIENSYAYFTSVVSGGVMPIGVSAGDIIFAGSNTPYYGKQNIND